MKGDTPHQHRVLAHRYHDISMGHRVAGHESKCASLHGHNYRIHFFVEGEKLDAVGRVVDFSVIKDRLCNWLEEFWDHKFMVFVNDPYLDQLKELPGVWLVPFNPTAENMAAHLVENIGPYVLAGTGVRLVKVEIEETRKCSASYELKD